MAETVENSNSSSTATPVVHVAPSPHLTDTALTTQRMMLDVLLALVPALLLAVYVFRKYAIAQVGICVISCVVAEAIFTALRKKKQTLDDLSAVVTGVILAFSLPAITPWWVSVIGAFSAIGIGKIIFGGLGHNIFNPAMVGRAFVMMAFAKFVSAGGYIAQEVSGVTTIMTQPTPMTAAFKAGEVSDGLLLKLFLGTANGSLGEVSALMLILGGVYLCIRRTASWEIPAGATLGLVAVAGIQNLLNTDQSWTVLHHLFGGAFLFGAFFIVTDPVTSPLTPKGKWIFGVLFGVLVMLIRLLANYPEGVMFSVLLVNALTPLLNRWTIPQPLGGPIPAKEPS